jgi:hypothetical protein
LPHRWTEAANGKAIQNVDVISYEINPADIETKFGKEKVVIRKMKK